MKKLMVGIALLAFTLPAGAQYQENDSIVINRPHKVTIVTNDKEQEIRVEGSENNPDYSYVKRISLNDDNYAVTQQKTGNWNFHIPFSKEKKNRKNRYSSDEVFCGGIYFGFVSATGAPEAMNVNMSSSYEIGGNIINFGLRPWKDENRFSVGFGMRWRNYRMNGYSRFIKDDNQHISIGSYPDKADIDFSRLKLFSLTVPFMYTRDLGRNFSFSVGPELCINTYGSMKTHYKDAEGNAIKLLDKNIHQQKVSFDLQAHLIFHAIGAYVRYSPCHVLNTDFGPEFQTFTAGISLFM